MATQISFDQGQVDDFNGDPAAGAKAYFYETGTTTPLTVYTDAALTTAADVPHVADANGMFAPVFVSGGSLKMVVTDADDVAIFTRDPVLTSATSATDAASISFTATSGIPENNVQDAVESVYASISAPGTLDLSGTDITWADDQIPGTAVADATKSAPGVVQKSTFAENRAGTATNVVPTVAGVVEILEGQPLGWRFEEDVFDQGDGAAETLTTSDFETRFDYQLVIRNLSHDGGTDQSLKLVVIWADDEREETADLGFSIPASGVWNGDIVIARAWQSDGGYAYADVVLAAAAATYGSDAATVLSPTVKRVIFGRGTSTTVKAVKLKTTSGVDFDAGFVGLNKRRA